MRLRPHGRTVALLVGTVLAFQWSLTAQAPSPSAKRPISYDVMDSWRSIAGTKVSSDGQWLAYGLTAQGDDGELVVRNLKSDQEFKSPRGTSPTFTLDGKFAVFTIAQLKADEEKERQQTQSQGQAGEEGRAGGQGGRGSQAARTPRTGMGIMSLPDGKVTTFDKVGSFRVPDENSTWLAYYKGVGGAGAGRGGRGAAAGRGGAAGGRQGAPPAAAAAGEGRGADGTREKRKDPGSDLILRNLVTGEETTIPEVTEYDFDTKGALLGYATSAVDATRDGAFVRRTADGSVVTLLAGRGHYKSLAFDDKGQQLAFFSDKDEYEKPVSPYRLYYWKATDAAATELVSASTPGMLKGMVVSDNAAPRFSKDGARLFLGTAPPPAPPADPDAKTPAPIQVDLWSTKDPLIQPMQKVRAEQERTRNYRAVVSLADKKLVQLATPELPTVNLTDDPAHALGMNDLPYRMEISWDQAYNDVYLLDIKSGKPQKVLEHWGSNQYLAVSR